MMRCPLLIRFHRQPRLPWTRLREAAEQKPPRLSADLGAWWWSKKRPWPLQTRLHRFRRPLLPIWRKREEAVDDEDVKQTQAVRGILAVAVGVTEAPSDWLGGFYYCKRRWD